MSRSRRWPVFIVLMIVAGWAMLTVATAVTRGEGHGGIFWTAVGLIALLTAALLWAAWRVGRRLVQPRGRR